MSSAFQQLVNLQEVSRWIRLPESGTESKLRLHQFRYLWMGFSGALQAHDSRLLGETVPPGGKT